MCQEGAKRRAQGWWFVGGAIVAIVSILVLLGARHLLYDSCTQSFDRSPQAVVLTFVTAVGQANPGVARECWEQHAYVDPEAGCSEICLSAAYGARFEITDVSVGGQYLTPDVRTNRVVKVYVACTDGGDSHMGEIVLDTVGPNLPWKHWHVVRSDFGGTAGEVWCK